MAFTPASTTSCSRVGGYRWVICALLFLATTINYTDRQILSLIKPILDDELKWTNEQFGLLNSAFQGAYAVSLVLFGWFIDKYGTKIGYAVSIAAWSIAAAGHALVFSVGGFLAARIALGLGEGGNFPSAIKACAQWFPKRERAFATTIFNSGSNVGAVLAPALVPVIVLHWGWHMAFIAAGAAGLLWLFLWLPFYNVPEKIKNLTEGELAHIRSDADQAGEAARIPWRLLLGSRQIWGLIAARFLTDPVWWFFLIWLPDFFKKTRGLDIKHSWVHLVTIYGIVTVLSIFGGWLTGWFARRPGWTITRARKSAMLCFAMLVVPVLVVTRVGDWTAVVIIGLAGAAHQAWSANLYTSASDMFPRRAVASVVGLAGMAGSVGGMLFPLFSGKLLDVFTARGDVTGGYAVLFAMCAFAYLVAFAVNHLLAPRFEPVRFPQT